MDHLWLINNTIVIQNGGQLPPDPIYIAKTGSDIIYNMVHLVEGIFDSRFWIKVMALWSVSRMFV